MNYKLIKVKTVMSEMHIMTSRFVLSLAKKYNKLDFFLLKLGLD